MKTKIKIQLALVLGVFFLWFNSVSANDKTNSGIKIPDSRSDSLPNADAELAASAPDFRQTKAAAEAGDRDAQANLGLLYLKSIGVTRGK